MWSRIPKDPEGDVTLLLGFRPTRSMCTCVFKRITAGMHTQLILDKEMHKEYPLYKLQGTVA